MAKILGLYTGHDQCVALLDGSGRLIASAEEERFTRVKHEHPHTAPFPLRGLAWLREDWATPLSGADLVALATPAPDSNPESLARTLAHLTSPDPSVFPTDPPFRARFYEHHLCHLATACVWSGWDDCYALAIDGGGATCFAMLARYRRLTADGPWRLEVLARDPMDEGAHITNPGAFYLTMTDTLGFRPVRDEGKVMCLAASGNAARFRDLFASRYAIGPYAVTDRRAPGAHRDQAWHPSREGLRQALREDLGESAADGIDFTQGQPRADFAAATQEAFEEMVWADVLTQVPQGARLAVAGGCFANVTMNRKLLNWASEVFVAPAMNDGGLAAGAALLGASDISPSGLAPARLANVYLGPDAGEALVAPEEVARRLARGEVIGVCHGRMELGPRALGHRSILADPRDPAIVSRLNAMLHRSGFMPFAPMIMAEYADDILEPEWRQAAHAAEFMTVAFAVQEAWRVRIPAVVHVDGTARPQIVTPGAEPWIWAVMDAFRRETGVPVLLNTSLNMHEEPICCTHEDALAVLRAGGVDTLVLGGAEEVVTR